MADLNLEYFERCIRTLSQAFSALQEQHEESPLYDIYRAACVKEFEIILEQSGKLLKKILKPYFSSPKQVDQLVFKEIFRYAAKFNILTLEEVERWVVYRDNRNNTAHDYGEGFAETTLTLLPHFIQDAQRLCQAIKQQ